MRYKRAMVWGAHPDDEITMGGTICKMVREGTDVTLIQFTNGNAGFCRREWKDKIVEFRKREAAACDKILGIKRRIMLGRDDQGVVNDRATIQECIRLIREFRPEALFSHGPVDKNRDHLAVASLVEEAVWQSSENVLATAGKPWRVSHVYWYKGFGLMGPKVVVDVKKYAKRKIDAWASQTTQVEMLPGIQRRIELGRRQLKEYPNEDLFGVYTETFVIHPDTALREFPPIG